MVSDVLRRLLDSLDLGKDPLYEHNGLAMVLPGGGARAAYQVGVMRGIARRLPDLKPRILTGVSAGALNASYLATRASDPFGEAVEDLTELWMSLHSSDIYRLDRPSIAGAVGRLFRRTEPIDPPEDGGVLDTSPLHASVERWLGKRGAAVPAIQKAINAGDLHALAVTTTSYTTGRSVTWVQGQKIAAWERSLRVAVETEIRPEHVLASASLPFFFPAVEVEDERLGVGWYGDGGIRLTAPLGPALNLGADKVLVINTRAIGATPARATNPPYPAPTEVLGILMNAVFLDVIDRDALMLRRINELLEHAPPSSWNDFRPVDLLVFRPSVDLAALAGDYEPTLPPSALLALRAVGADVTRSPEWLSMLLFEEPYLRRLLEMGEADVEARIEEVAAFLTGSD